MADSVSDGVSKPKKNPVPKGLTPFTPMNARQAQEASVKARNLRKQVRSEIVRTMAEKLNLGEEMVKAFKAHDIEQMTLIEKTLKLVGLDYNSSDEAKVQNVKLDATTKNENKNDNTVRFIIDNAKPEDAE